MTCQTCYQPAKAALWTPIPEFRQPTEIQQGENVDCYMKRSGSPSGLMNDVGPKTPDRIDNTSLTSDLHGTVNETFKLSDNSTKVAASWAFVISGTTSLAPLTELAVSGATISGTVLPANINKNYKVMVTALDSAGTIIDAREFNFFPKTGSADGTLKFVIPLEGTGAQAVHVTCGYGPRHPPTSGASSDHLGMDFARKDHSAGNIVASCDGVVTKCGPGTGWGNVIFIEHKDATGKVVATTVYAHWSEAYVKVGQIVAAGQKIALEGNVGIGTGIHLHFEMHKGKWKNPTDPAPYLTGAIPVADNNTDVPGPDGTATPTSESTKARSNVGMTAAESSAAADCPASIPAPAGGDTFTPTDIAALPANASVTDAINQACTEAGLSADETKFIFTLAKIESTMNPAAKNPTSSALGLYQMLDAIAAKYYGLLGKAPSVTNRTDPYLATKAMILFYKNEFLPYWNGYVSSGHATIAGKKIIPTTWSATYPQLDQFSFMYGLLHHDGVGNAVNGIDKQGVAYWKSKVA